MTRPEASALLAAYEVEDFLCRAFNSRAERLAALKEIILGAIERSMPIPPSDSVAPPCAVPAGPPAVDRPRVPPEDMPLPQPAVRPRVQDEAVGKQGEDQRAQKSEAVVTVDEAGAAQAEPRNADPRNSSRPAVKAPASAAGRTGPSNQERVMNLWATTDLTRQQIAARVGCSDSSVSAYVSIAKKAGDPRGNARAVEPDAKIAELKAAAQPKPVLIKKAAPVEQEERGPTMAGIARAVARKPFDEPAPPPAKPTRLIGVTIDQPGSVVSIDSNMLVVACPGGDWQASKPVIRTIAKMRNGDLFDCKTLADAGDWASVDYFLNQAKAWQRDLAALGVELVIMPKVGCRLRLAEASAA